MGSPLSAAIIKWPLGMEGREEDGRKDADASRPASLVLSESTIESEARSKRISVDTPMDEILYPMRARRSSRRTGKTINGLSDDVLLNIFHFHWSTVDAHWSQRWCTLAYVCRRWNQLIFTSSHHLGLRLRFSFGAQVEDMITYSPPFPLALDYHTRYGQMWTFSDIDGVLFALQHLQRAHEIVLSAPASTLSKLTGVLTGQAPILEHLELESQTTELILPTRILDMHAPRLRHLQLSGCVLPALHPLLSSASFLVNLTLHRIPSSASFSPDSLASCIRTMSRLQTLSLSILSAAPGSAGDRVPSPIQTPSDSERAELPMLQELAYRGPSTYLDALLAKFRAAPLMRKIHLGLFNQLTFSIPHVASFIHASTVSESPTLALIDFYESSATLTAIPARPIAVQRPRRRHRSRRGDDDDDGMEMSIRVPCERLDFQLSALAAICGALARTLGPIAELMIGFYARELPPPPYSAAHRDDAIDAALWLALVAPFRGARTLRVDAALGAELSRALASSVGAEGGGAGEGEGGEEGERRERPLPALRAVEPLYQANSEPDAFVPSVSEACALLHQLAERNLRLAERSVVVEAQ
ncbi:hypothetical protein BJV78DRAFT_1152943 [Lactifluus subvellereus]|nr:hypothetical protein BJV78DRAFT_1152943 [Lactifluus subvellereus]